MIAQCYDKNRIIDKLIIINQLSQYHNQYKKS